MTRPEKHLDPDRFAVRSWTLVFICNTGFVLVAVAVAAFRYWRGLV